MFYAIDKNTCEIILSLNVRDKNYKDTYNKELRFKCAGSCKNGQECDDENVVFVNSKLKQAHFRHSSGSKCSAHKAYIEFNNYYNIDWFKLFKVENRKPYWYNYKLEQITDDNNVIMIRYSQQKSETIRSIEQYTKSKIIWILSLENRKYSDINYYKGKIYIDFKGSKNDIPLYNDEKSIVYLDTGDNILLKVLLNSTSCYGQEIELIDINDFCKEYDDLFIAYPYRKNWNKLEELNIQNENGKIYEKYYYDLMEYYLKHISKKWFSIDKRYNILLKLDNTYIELAQLLSDDYINIGDELLWPCHIQNKIANKQLLFWCNTQNIQYIDFIKRFDEYTFSKYNDILYDFNSILHDNSNYNFYDTTIIKCNGKYKVLVKKYQDFSRSNHCVWKEKGKGDIEYYKTFFTIEGCKMYIYTTLEVVGITYYRNYYDSKSNKLRQKDAKNKQKLMRLLKNNYTEERIEKIEVYHNDKLIKAFQPNENIIGNSWFNDCLL